VKRRTATYPRALRVNQVLRQVVAEELERLADADELPMITVTSVDTAADMRTAVVYLASLDAETSLVLEVISPRLAHFPNLESEATIAQRSAAQYGQYSAPK